MTMDTNQCPKCGGLLVQDGADMAAVYYHCTACGDQIAVPISEEGGVNAVYAQRRRDVMGRLRMGFVDWRVTQWDRLYTDLIDFINRYEEAQHDIQVQMGLVACITRGFNIMDAERYKQCRNLFKLTERMYKTHLKALKAQVNPELYETVAEYKESRARYKRCLNQYRNTKLAWKAVFFVVKKIVPLGF